MKWRGRAGSSNIEDRRGMSGGGMAVGGGLGGLVLVLLISVLTGQNPAVLINTVGPSSDTVAPGAAINAGAFIVPAALGNKRIRPFGDFLLHNVGTGDGIVQNGGQGTRNQVRTPPLWGMRSRDRLMHDGESLTRNEAILRHAGQANAVINNYILLSDNQKNQLITFLNSL